MVGMKKNEFEKATLTDVIIRAIVFLRIVSGCAAQTTPISAVVNGTSLTQDL